MIFVFLMMTLILSSASLMISHPVALVAVIISQTLVICLLSHLITATSWFAFIIFLIFLGGVMVLFIYISSLASNENFLTNWKSFLMLLMISLSMFFTILKYSNYTFVVSSDLNFFNLIDKMYSSMSVALVFSTMLYLLMSLIIVAEIIKHYQAPLRASH